MRNSRKTEGELLQDNGLNDAAMEAASYSRGRFNRIYAANRAISSLRAEISHFILPAQAQSAILHIVYRLQSESGEERMRASVTGLKPDKLQSHAIAEFTYESRVLKYLLLQGDIEYEKR
jgi:hypothetical protein